MKILPSFHGSVPYLRQDGEVESVPFQAMRLSNGQLVLRLGNTTLWFNENGQYDGYELRAADCTPEQIERLQPVIAHSEDRRHTAPEVPYFMEGTKGADAERAGWPKTKEGVKGEPYAVVGSRGNGPKGGSAN